MFRDVENLKDFGISLEWPEAPLLLNGFVCSLQRIYKRWRAQKILLCMPKHLRDSLPQKLAAYETFRNQRSDWGYSDYWLGDYLSLV